MDETWIQGGIVSAFGAIVVVLKTLWGKHLQSEKELKERAAVCEAKHEASQEAMLAVKDEMIEVKALALGHAQAREDLKSGDFLRALAEETLKGIADGTPN